jgi:hypothetical protein
MVLTLDGSFHKTEGETAMVNKTNSFMVSPYAAFVDPVVNAYLHNPAVDKVTYRYPFKDEEDIETLEPCLVFGSETLDIDWIVTDELLHVGLHAGRVRELVLSWIRREEARILTPRTRRGG